MSDDVNLQSFSLLFLFFLPSVTKSVLFSLLKKKYLFRHKTQNFSSFSLFREGRQITEKDDRLPRRTTDYHRERIVRHLSLSHKTRFIHIHYYEFHAKRAITTSVGSVRTEPATSSRDFNHKGSFSKSFFKERERERDE